MPTTARPDRPGSERSWSERPGSEGPTGEGIDRRRRSAEAPGQAWVAAHSAETATAGLEVLQAGGNAADAAAAMTMAACVVEPLVTSLLSGMHAIHVSPRGVVTAVDGFVDVPLVTEGGRTAETEVLFDDERVPYTIGGATFGVPALVDGCAQLNRRFGRLPWAELLQPALRLAATGFTMGAQDEALLRMLEPVMRLDAGRTVFSRDDGSLKGAGDQVWLPGIDGVLERLAEEGPATLYGGDLGEELARFCAERGALVTARDLAEVRAVVHTPPTVVLPGAGGRGPFTIRSRRGLSPLMDWLDHLARQDPEDVAVLRLAAVQGPDIRQHTGTTSLAAADADGGACAVTSSLGLGTGDWFHGSQLNSMLGEVALQQGALKPRTRMGSMMAPTAVLDDGGVVAVLGSAGGSRIPSAVIRVIDGMTSEGLDAVAAVELPRLHRIGGVVHVEPHMGEEEVQILSDAGWEVRRWSTRNHFFGGVSVAGPAGACGDPRRDGTQLAHLG